MFGDIGWAELLLIGIVALIIIGPEDLPDLFRQLGRFTAKLRSMSREFSRAMEQAAKESGVKDVANSIKAVTSPTTTGMNKVRQAADRFEKWDPLKNTAVPTKPMTSGVIKGPIPPEGSIAAPPAVATLATTSAGAEVSTETIGPATQAQYDKKAAKAAILRETNTRLKAIDAGEAAEPAGQPKKPRAPRKTKKADEA